ncbi:hypothetical protein ACOSQ2_010240 [Xanthoceras sorbifolium]
MLVGQLTSEETLACKSHVGNAGRLYYLLFMLSWRVLKVSVLLMSLGDGLLVLQVLFLYLAIGNNFLKIFSLYPKQKKRLKSMVLVFFPIQPEISLMP